MIFVGCKMKAVVCNYFQNLDKNFYALGIPKLFHQYEKWIAFLGDYVEK